MLTWPLHGPCPLDTADVSRWRGRASQARTVGPTPSPGLPGPQPGPDDEASTLGPIRTTELLPLTAPAFTSSSPTCTPALSLPL